MEKCEDQVSSALALSWPGAVAQWIKHLLHKHGDWSSGPQPLYKAGYNSRHLKSQCDFDEVRVRDRRIPGILLGSQLDTWHDPHDTIDPA